MCQSCEEEREGKWKCAGCNSEVLYCSKAGQIADWPHDCYAYRGKTVPSVYHLSCACYCTSFEAQTLESYGFNKVFTPYNQMMLLGLYHGLFKYFEINPKTFLTWKRKDILIQEIQKVFEEIPPQNRGHSTLHGFLNIKTFSIRDPSQEPSAKVVTTFPSNC